MAGSGSYLMNKSIVPDNSVNTATHTASRSPLFQRVTLFVIWAWLIVFALIPNILVVLASFMTRDEDSFLALPLTAESYLRFIDPLYVKVFLHSLSMASITTLICLILGYPFAWLVSRVSKKMAIIFDVIAHYSFLDQLFGTLICGQVDYCRQWSFKFSLDWHGAY